MHGTILIVRSYWGVMRTLCCYKDILSHIFNQVNAKDGPGKRRRPSFIPIIENQDHQKHS